MIPTRLKGLRSGQDIPVPLCVGVRARSEGIMLEIRKDGWLVDGSSTMFAFCFVVVVVVVCISPEPGKLEF